MDIGTLEVPEEDFSRLRQMQMSTMEWDEAGEAALRKGFRKGKRTKFMGERGGGGGGGKSAGYTCVCVCVSGIFLASCMQQDGRDCSQVKGGCKEGSRTRLVCKTNRGVVPLLHGGL